MSHNIYLNKLKQTCNYLMYTLILLKIVGEINHALLIQNLLYLVKIVKKKIILNY